MEDTSWVVFRVAAGKCALRTDDVRKVVHIPLLARPPGLPPLVKGFMDFAGIAIPVLSLDSLLGCPEGSFHPYLHVLILKDNARPLGLIVDRVETVARLPERDLVNVDADESLNGCVAAKTRIEGQETYILAADRLMGARERQVLAELQTMQQQRLTEMGAAL
jgi:purine-binding chemotaxis protein CheW